MILCFVFLSQLVASIVFISFGVIAAFCCAIVDGVFAARHIVSASRKTQVLQGFYGRKTSDGVNNPISGHINPCKYMACAVLYHKLQKNVSVLQEDFEISS